MNLKNKIKFKNALTESICIKIEFICIWTLFEHV